MSIHERFSEQELAILKARAERAASLSDRDAAQTTLTVLQIMLGEETYGLPVNDLRAVYEDVIVVPVPGTPPFVAGIANVRGRILPVLDLPVLLGVPDQAAALGTRALVVANRDAMTVALAIEAVGEIVAVAGQEICAGSRRDQYAPNQLSTRDFARRGRADRHRRPARRSQLDRRRNVLIIKVASWGKS